jgi:hypothetical protein
LHAFADIEQQVTDKIRFFFELLEVEAIALPEYFPIDVPEIVATDILAMLGEFIRKSSIRAAMEARHITLDDSPSAQLQPI